MRAVLTADVQMTGCLTAYTHRCYPAVQSYGFVLRWYESQHTQSSQQRRQSQPGESSSSGILSGQQHHQQRDAASSSVTAPGVDSLSAYDSKGRYLPTPWQGFVAGCTAGLMQVGSRGVSEAHAGSVEHTQPVFRIEELN
jgi:hypothetical protein